MVTVAPAVVAASIAEVQVLLSGDIGGNGISRYHFARNDAGPVTAADATAAGNAVRGIYNSVSLWPSTLTISFNPVVQIFDVDSALVQGSVSMTATPNAIAGTVSGAYGAGLGARINWKTGTVQGRRLLRGATFLVPLASGAFSSNGAVGAAAQTGFQAAGQAYIAAMNAAQLQPMVWHRPPKLTHTGGVIGPVTAASVRSTPAGLRSRRS